MHTKIQDLQRDLEKAHTREDIEQVYRGLEVDRERVRSFFGDAIPFVKMLSAASRDLQDALLYTETGTPGTEITTFARAVTKVESAKKHLGLSLKTFENLKRFLKDFE